MTPNKMTHTDQKYERDHNILQRLSEKYGEYKLLNMLVNINGYQEMRKAAHEALDMYDDDDINDIIRERTDAHLEYKADYADRVRSIR